MWHFGFSIGTNSTHQEFQNPHHLYVQWPEPPESSILSELLFRSTVPETQSRTNKGESRLANDCRNARFIRDSNIPRNLLKKKLENP